MYTRIRIRRMMVHFFIQRTNVRVLLVLLLGLSLLGLTLVATLIRKYVFDLPRAWRPLTFIELLQAGTLTTFDGKQAYLSPCLDRRALPYADVDAANNDTMASSRLELDLNTYIRSERWAGESEENTRKYSLYLPMLTITDKARLLGTWQVFHKACDLHNISYFLVEGSLLGAIRHGGIIPWDDDIDVAVDVRHMGRLQRALSCLPGFTLRVQNNMHWKFFAREARVVLVSSPPVALYSKTITSVEEAAQYVPALRPVDEVVMRFPFVDIFLTADKNGFTTALTSYVSRYVHIRTADIYPLTFTPFDGYMAPIPQRAQDIVKALFDFDTCESPSHNHKIGKAIDNASRIPCKELLQMYFIHEI